MRRRRSRRNRRTTTTNNNPTGGGGDESSSGAEDGAEIPESARAVLNQVDESGSPLSGYKGGSTFANDGRAGGQMLPQMTPGGDPITYREWDINPYQKGVNRGAERLVTRGLRLVH